MSWDDTSSDESTTTTTTNRPTTMKHVPIDLACRFHHYMPDLDNINPTFLGPENQLTHCISVVVFGGTELFGSYTQSNSMYVLELGNMASRNQVMSLCNQEQVDYFADGKLISFEKETERPATPTFSLHWQKVEYGSSEQVPPPREFPCFSYEKYSQKCYLFGGYGGQYYNDVWEFNLLNRTWTRLNTHGKIPSTRCGCSGIANKYGLVVFGGYNGRYLDDFYFLDFRTRSWVQIATNPGYSPGTLTVLTNNSCISDCSFFVFGGYSGTAYMNDFFAFDFTYNDPSNLGKWVPPLRNLTPAGNGFKANCLMLRGLSSIYGTHMIQGHHTLLISGFKNSTNYLYELEEESKTLYVYDLPAAASAIETNLDSHLVFELDESTVGILCKHYLLVLGVRPFKLNYPFLCFRKLYKPYAFSDVNFEWN